jgi:hypothetical protein
MKNLRLPDNQWHTFTQSLLPGAFENHWGGANDNVIHLPLKAIGIGVYEHGPKAGNILIDKLASTVQKIEPKDVLSLTARTDVPSATAVVGETAHVIFTIANRTSQPQQALLHIQISSMDKQVNEQPQPITLGSFANQTIQIPISTENPGLFTIKCSLEQDGQTYWQQQQAMAVVPKHPSQGMVDPTAVMGLMFVNDYQTADRIGCKFDRLQVYWKFTSRSPRTYDWTRIDEHMANAKANHVQIILTLRPTLKPNWAKWQTYEQLLEPQHIGDYTHYVRTATERYKDQLLAIEIGNEPDLGFTHTANLSPDRAAYVAAKLQRIAYDLIKSIAPDLPILGQSISGVDFKQEFNFSDKVVSYADGPIFDYFAGHPYCDARLVGQGKTPLDPWLAQTRDKLLGAVDWLKRHQLNTDIWNTELGWALSPQDDLLSIDSKTYARMVALGIITSRTVPNLKKLTWFCMSLKSLERGFSYGLFEPNGQPRLALCAYAAAAGVLHHAIPVGPVKIVTPDVIAWQFHADSSDKDTFVLWTHESQLSCRTSAPSFVQMIDMFGRTLNVSQDKPWQLGQEPLYLQCSADKAQATLKWLETCVFKPEFDVVLASCLPVDAHTLQIKLDNYQSQPVQITCHLNDSKTAHTLTPGSNLLALWVANSNAPIGMSIQTPQYNIERSFDFKLRQIEKINTFTIDGIIADETGTLTPISLDSKRSIQPLDPNIGWDGPNDLSYQAWVGWHQDGLYLAFRVTDDKYVAQHANTPDFWRNDSIQLAILPENHDRPNYTKHDLELGLAWDNKQTYVWQTHPGQTRLISNVQLSVTRDDPTHVMYESLIPWSALNCSTPQAGHIIGLNFVVNDDDGKGRSYWMGLTPGIADGKMPGMYDRFILVP